MEFRESESIELKRMYIDDIRKEVIAIWRMKESKEDITMLRFLA